MTGFSFEHPVWLVALGAGMVMAVIGLRWFTTMSGVRRAVSAGLRVVLVALVALALAGAASVRESDRMAVVAVVDLSQSVVRFASVDDEVDSSSGLPAHPDEAFGERVLAFLDGSAPDRSREDLLGIVVFDGSAAAVTLPTGSRLGAPVLDLPGAAGTDLARAMRFAAGLLPPDAPGRLLIISDGNETAGRAMEVADQLASQSGIAVDVAPVRLEVEREVVVERAASPPSAPSGSVVDVRALLRATAPARGTLRVLADGVELDVLSSPGSTGLAVDLPAGRSAHVLPVRLPQGRVHRFEVRFEPEQDAQTGRAVSDTSATNNAASAFTVSDDAGAVLYVTNTPGVDPIASSLAESGYEVVTASTDALPDTLVGYEAYDLIILDDVAADDASPEAWSRLAEFVSSLGGGLITLGGPDSYAAGGWRGSALEAMLPVSLDVPDRVVVPDAAVVFVLDSSGSMGRRVLGSTRTQQAIANESTALAIGVLAPTDYVGVIEFDSRARIVWPIGPNQDTEQAQEAARYISAGGGTVLGPALEMAADQLAGVEAKTRRVIVLSDGQSEDAARIPDIASRMAADGIILTCIAVGDDADTRTLRQVAELGGGAFYEVNNAEVLPQVFLKAVRVIREPLLREQPFVPIVLREGSPVMAGLGAPPRLGGLTLTSDRPDPSVVRVLQTEDGFPVLAHWNAGLGTVVAFTSEAERWGETWRAWDEFGTFWSRLARLAARPPVDPRFELRLDVEGGVARVELEAIDDDGSPMDALTVPVTLYAPGGASREVTLVQTEPGRYSAESPVEGAGVHVAVARPTAGQSALRPVVAGAAYEAQAEFLRLESDVALLERLAERTGGRVFDLDAPRAGSLFDRDGVEPKRALTSLAPMLLGWAVVVFLLDVAARRLAWDRALSSRFGEGWSGAARAQTATRRVESTGALAQRATRRERADEAGVGVAQAAPTSRDVLRERIERERAKAAAEREQGVAQSTHAGGGSASPATKREEPKKTDSDDDAGGSGLLAAKRRATKRFEED